MNLFQKKMKIADFPANKAVFTTKMIMNKQDVIFYVSWDRDGDIQCLGNGDNTPASAMIVSIAQILQLDNTLHSLPALKKGDKYIRQTPNSEWEFFKG
jgi:hypothetical protein